MTGHASWWVSYGIRFKYEVLTMSSVPLSTTLLARGASAAKRPELVYSLFEITLKIRSLTLTDLVSAASSGHGPRVANNGDNDAAPENQPSQFLLFRGLEPSVTEELLAKGVTKLYKPPPSNNAQATQENQKKGAKVASTTGDSNLGAREGSLRRVLLVRDRRSNESWRYGFAEFATVDVLPACAIFFSYHTDSLLGCQSCINSA